MDHYARMMNAHLRDWLEQPVVNIGRDEVQMRHHQISYQDGPAVANSTMRMLSSIMTYAAFRYPLSDKRTNH